MHEILINETGGSFSCIDDELINLGFDLAAGEINEKYLLDWIIDHS